MAIDKRFDPGRSSAGDLAANRGLEGYRASVRTTAGRRAGVLLGKGHSREACPAAFRKQRQAAQPGPRRVDPELLNLLIDDLDSRETVRKERLAYAGSMKLVIDTDARTLAVEEAGKQSVSHELYGREAFAHISRQWVRAGWSLRYYHGFTWMGLPVLQLPDDLVRLQEVFWEVRPRLVIETGVFQGGSLLFHASLCKALGQGRVVGVDIDMPASLRETVARRDVGSLITLIQGDSASPEVLRQIEALRNPDETTLVLLDSDHSREHVRRELEAFAPIVTEGSYLIVADTIMRDLADVPGGEPSWIEDSPAAAVDAFLADHPEFERVSHFPPDGLDDLPDAVSYWGGGWLRRRACRQAT